MMSLLIQIFLMITFIISCTTEQQNDKITKPLSPSSDGSDLNVPTHQRTFHLPTYVVNVFPEINVSAFILFEQDRVSRLHYGNVQHFNATMEPHSDFIIQFRQIPTDVVRSDYTDFGFMESELSQNKEIILLISRNPDNLYKPKHHLIVFDHSTVDIDSTKLYIYNGIWNKRHREKGLYFYGLYQRKNVDGSESESITQLAVNLLMNTGLDINLQPSTKMDIKGFYTAINSVTDFKTKVAVVQYKGYRTQTGHRKYLIAYGDFIGVANSTQTTRPRLVLLENGSEDASSAGVNLQAVPFAINALLFLIIRTLY